MDTGHRGWLEFVPERHRATIVRVLDPVIDLDAVTGCEAVHGGASGALVYRLDVPDGRLLLRIETTRDVFRNPHRTYPVMCAASDAGIAPRVRIADPDAGIVLMEFVDQRPLAEHPGGREATAHEVGRMIARLQHSSDVAAAHALAPDVTVLLDGMLAMLESGRTFRPGVLAPIRAGFDRIRDRNLFAGTPQVPSHNDVNTFNVLSDGQRLWFVDWELAFPNDPLADVACAANNFADGTDVGDVGEIVLRGWLGGEPDEHVRARFAVMRELNRLFYACIMLLSPGGEAAPFESFAAPTVDELRTMVESGQIRMASAELLHTLGRMQLAGFAAGTGAAGFDDVLAAALNGARLPAAVNAPASATEPAEAGSA